MHSREIMRALFTRFALSLQSFREDKLHSLKIKQALFTRLYYLCSPFHIIIYIGIQT